MEPMSRGVDMAVVGSVSIGWAEPDVCGGKGGDET